MSTNVTIVIQVSILIYILFIYKIYCIYLCFFKLRHFYHHLINFLQYYYQPLGICEPPAGTKKPKVKGKILITTKPAWLQNVSDTDSIRQGNLLSTCQRAAIIKFRKVRKKLSASTVLIRAVMWYQLFVFSSQIATCH